MAAVAGTDSPSKRRKPEEAPGEGQSPDMFKMASKETTRSPPRKGVGLFGLESSPPMNGDIDLSVKDPKV